MELFQIPITAGATLQFAKAGRYFEIIDSLGPIRVDFVGSQGQQTDSMVNALSGLFISDPFAAFSVTSATTQTVTVLLMENGTGGSRRQPGIVSVTNKIGAATRTVGGGLPQAAGFNVTQFVAPASNVGGLVVRSATTGCATSAVATGNAAQVVLLGAPVAPASTLPNPGVILMTAYNPGTTYLENSSTDKNTTLPVGWGMWAVSQNSGVSAGSAGANMSYELL